jgi:2,5-dihydroxypyridine 5,6-dioxygenase
LATGAYILELMGGARNLVQYANLAPGEEVVLAAGTQVDPIVTQAVLAALSEQPVTITTVVVPDPGPLFHEPPLPVVEAVAAADTLIDVGAHIWGYTRACYVSMTEYLTKGILVAPPVRPDVFTSRAATFPIDLLHAIELRISELVQQPDGTPYHLVAPNGTDLRGQVWRDRTGQGWGSIAGLMPGDFLVWPPGVVGFLPPKAADGMAVFDFFTGFGKTSVPVSYVIEGQRIVEVRGGYEAEDVRQMIAAATNGDFVAGITWGVNPAIHVDLTTGPVSLEAARSPQALHIGIGDEKLSGSPIRSVRPDGSTFHLDALMVYPTLTVDGETVLDRGRLPFLDDHGFRELAAEFGDPDELLAYPQVRGY